MEITCKGHFLITVGINYFLILRFERRFFIGSFYVPLKIKRYMPSNGLSNKKKLPDGERRCYARDLLTYLPAGRWVVRQASLD